MADFGARLEATFGSRGHLCLGIDPHAFLLADWGVADTADGVREFALRVVDAASSVVGIVKPQVAFFERHGAAGYAVLEEVLAAARAAGLLVIADAKRGDIGSTIAAYGQAWLEPGSTLEADAVTVVAYQGVGSLAEPLSLAASQGKGVFVLSATSNPEAFATQTARLADGTTVAAGIVNDVDEINSAAGLGSIGVVLGATVSLDDFGIDRARLARTPILAPGFGEQGALLGDVRTIYGSLADNAIVNLGRGVLRGGAQGFADRLSAAHAELAGAIAS